MVPRGDLNEGDSVLVRVLPDEPHAGRAARSLLGNMLVTGVMLFGVVITGAMVLMWYGLDKMLGRSVPEGSWHPSHNRRST